MIGRYINLHDIINNFIWFFFFFLSFFADGIVDIAGFAAIYSSN